MHLRWLDLPSDVQAVEVDLEVEGVPPTPHLRFWALQASFVDGAASQGAGHLGLQWIDGYPGHTAVNWGGYRNGGGELTGTESALPSARGNVNTRNYQWTPGQVYGLRIEKSGSRPEASASVDGHGSRPEASASVDGHGSRPGVSRTNSTWRGVVIDRATGEAVVVRELVCPGTNLDHIVMWSEIFAPCDAPKLTVAWSNATAITPTGAHPITSFSVSYQSVADGGCSNSDVSVGRDGRVIQTTNIDRQTAAGSVIS